MIVPRHSIFRDKALKHYAQGRRKDVLPHFSSVPVALFLWVLIGLLIATGMLARYAQVPVYLTGAGIILSTGEQAPVGSNETPVIAFIPSGTTAHLRVGLTLQMQSGDGSAALTSTIIRVELRPVSLASAFAAYNLNNSNSSLANQPVTLLFIRSGSASLPSAGSALALNVNMGTESLISALLG